MTFVIPLPPVRTVQFGYLKNGPNPGYRWLDASTLQLQEGEPLSNSHPSGSGSVNAAGHKCTGIEVTDLAVSSFAFTF